MKPESIEPSLNLDSISTQTTRPRVFADEIVDTLAELGITQAFGVPGGAFIALEDSLSQSKNINTIFTQHECSAAYMAMGHSMALKGKGMGLCFSTAGPGITNLITGVAAAYEERLPLFVLTGNVSVDYMGKVAAQDAFETGINAIKMLEPVTLFSETFLSHEKILLKIKAYYNLALEKRRPIHVNIPSNIASLKFNSYTPRYTKNLQNQ